MRAVAALSLLLAWPVAAQQPALIGYFAGPSEALEAHRIDQLTHLIWCFAHLRGDSLSLHGPNWDRSDGTERSIATVVRFKERNPTLRVLLSFGGWGGCETCSEVFSREEGRRAFIASALRLLEQTHTDGLDLDWEYPAVAGPPGHAYSDADRHNFTLLVRELRKAFGDRYEISFAAGGTDECLLKGFEWESIMPVVDRVHIMSYDLVHGYSRSTGHHTPLYSTPAQELSVEHAVHLLDSLHVPRNKIIIGSAFYARVWKDVPATNNGLFQTGSFMKSVPYHAFGNLIIGDAGWVFHTDSAACAGYAYNNVLHQFATFDDPSSVASKAGYVRRERLGGIMFWQLADDQPSNGLLNVMYKALRTR